MKDQWRKIPVGKCLTNKKYKAKKSLQTDDYKKSGEFPIIDQGSGFIAGYTDNKDLVNDEGLPVIIFGDHTRIFKYISFPFVTGADGTKILRPNTDILDPEFFYFSLLGLKVPNRGYNRHFKKLRELQISFPASLGAQRVIAGILKTVQRAKEVREAELALERERKAALMAHLFTYGTRNEPRKQTDIGEIPESWEVLPLKEVTQKAKQRDPRKEPEKSFVYVDVSSISNERFEIVETSNVMGADAPSRARKIIKTGDIIFATVRPTLRRIAVISTQYDDQICSTGYCVIRPDTKRLDTSFIFSFLLSEQVNDYVASKQKGATYPAINDGDLYDMLVPVPPIEEQREIGKIYAACHRKCETLYSEINILSELFQSMLDQLMTGQLSVEPLLEKTPVKKGKVA